MLSIHSPEHYMQQALLEAEKGFEIDEVPVGAVIVCENRIIARAHNQTQMLNDVTAHAEMLALTSASNYLGGKYLKGCEIYITLEPCTMCAGAIAWAQLDKVYFATEDDLKGYSKFVTSNIFNSKTLINKGILQDESKMLLKSFFKKLRK